MNNRHPLKHRRDDLYETPAVAVEALLRVEKLPHRLWEPACGRGAIVDVLREAGHQVIASDLVDHGRPDFFSRRDFLMEPLPKGVEAIITNPPFKLAEQFVAHALDLSPRVVMLLRLAFVESERRADLIERRGLCKIHVFAKRLPMMHRAGWNGPRASSNIPFARFCWDQAYRGPTEIDRIRWEQAS